MKSMNLLLTFLLEVCLLAALAYIGYHVTSADRVRVVLAACFPAAAMTVWSIFLAPRAKVKLPTALKLGLKGVLFGTAFISLILLDRPRIGIAFAAVYAINLVLLAAWKQTGVM